MPRPSRSPVSGREAATRALLDAAARFPNLDASPSPDTGALPPAEAALAVAIHRTVLQRWLTLEHLLDRHLSQPCARLEPAMRAVMLAGAAQLLFMQRVPVYAVVDEMVALAQKLVRPKAGGMANAVLRRIADDIDTVAPGAFWSPAARALPLDDGALYLKDAALPEPAELAQHLSLATSHPPWLVQRWLDAFEREAVIEICRQGVCAPPTIVALDKDSALDLNEPNEHWTPHESPGFVVWHGPHEALVQLLAQHPHRRVQDPASYQAVTATNELPVRSILDYCAGRGTKTVQLAVQHPGARILACDPDPGRAAALQQVSERFDNVEVVAPADALAERVDLLLLDVPCSNTGVLGRRPEARYRLNDRRLAQLVALQQQIFDKALPTVTRGGWVLYSTCSLEPEENDQQTRWIEEQTAGELVREALTLPAGTGAQHHDGSYHALVQA